MICLNIYLCKGVHKLNSSVLLLIKLLTLPCHQNKRNSVKHIFDPRHDVYCMESKVWLLYYHPIFHLQVTERLTCMIRIKLLHLGLFSERIEFSEHFYCKKKSYYIFIRRVYVLKMSILNY